VGVVSAGCDGDSDTGIEQWTLVAARARPATATAGNYAADEGGGSGARRGVSWT